MPMISKTSTYMTILSFKLVLISTCVLSAALMLAITDFSVYVPSIYNGLVSWLRPPYLYLVINCIVITIVVSSKLQSGKDEVSPSPTALTLGTMSIVQPQAVAALPLKTDYMAAGYKMYNGVVLENSIGYEVNAEKGLEFYAYEHVVKSTKNEKVPFIANAAEGGVGAFMEDAMNNKENEFVIANSKWTAPENKDSGEYSPSYVKPPVSARFGHRRNVKASPEGSGGKTVLGVSKTKKQDTLETTWKTITEGRAIPISRHLRKSDTWERNSQQLEKTPQKTMAKAETFNNRINTSSGSGGGLGKPKREASLGQDELNRRVEAFIKKFNEDMRLQRQESLNQYMEMINRGSH